MEMANTCRQSIKRFRAHLALVATLTALLAACGRHVGPGRPAERPVHAALADGALAVPAPGGLSLTSSQVARLRGAGQLEQFVVQALDLARREPDNLPARALQLEALLASGQNLQARRTALELWQQAARASGVEQARLAQKAWTTATLRCGLPLDVPGVARLLERDPEYSADVAALRFWRSALGGRAPYRLAAGGHPSVELPLARQTVVVGGLPYQIDGLALNVNDHAIPMALVDSGAQFTLLDERAARAAGVTPGSTTTTLTGFVAASVRPALVRRLTIAQLELLDVPVLVGRWAPLDQVQGQMAIGTDLMHHLRFTLDPQRLRVEVAAAAGPPPPVPADSWQIPLWTFSQACLAEGRLASGKNARVLIDSGNRLGTYVSARWAGGERAATENRSLPWHQRPHPCELQLTGLTLAQRRFDYHLVRNRLPADLERLDLVDVLVGHDLLAGRAVCIDLARRRLILSHSSTSPAADDEDHATNPNR
jgi:hypothetical protein